MSGDKFLTNPNNISFMWYTDGVPLFKSSKISIWPLFLSINELPYQDRIKQENMLFAGLANLNHQLLHFSNHFMTACLIYLNKVLKLNVHIVKETLQ